MKIKHTSAIDFPNGEGYTPCTLEYAGLLKMRESIYDPNIDDKSLEDLSSEDYEKWHQIDNQMNILREAGHMGKPVRY